MVRAFQEADHCELNGSGFGDVIDGRLDCEVTELRRVKRIVVSRQHGADDGHHGAPLFLAVLVEVVYVTWVSEQVS